MWRIILADWRRFALILLSGWAAAIFIVLLVYRGFANDCCFDDPAKRLMILRVTLVALVYSQTPAVLWAQYSGNHIYYRQRLIAALPLSQQQLNLTHYLTGLILLAGGTLTWIVIHYVWASFGLSLEPWLAVFSLLVTVDFLLLSMRNLFPRVLIPMLVPILIMIPGTEKYTGGLLETAAKWPLSLLIGVFTLFFAWWVAKRPTPEWAPGGRGNRRSYNTPGPRP